MARHDDLIAALTAAGWTEVHRKKVGRFGECACFERPVGRNSLLVPCDESIGEYGPWITAVLDELLRLADLGRRAQRVIDAVGWPPIW
jgi:hypothetical protein